jgi:alpha-tubulin suppressor-like RCC1 family protein
MINLFGSTNARSTLVGVAVLALVALGACTGTDSTAPLLAPDDADLARASSPNLRASALSAGWNHACAVADRDTYCWGRNADGQLGDGTTTQHDYASVVQTKQRFVELATGSQHSCGLTSNGTAYCWGAGDWGQLGDGTKAAQLTPVPVATRERFTTIEAGTVATCAITRRGKLYCWGWLVGSVNPATPLLLGGSQTFKAVSVSEILVCAIGTDDRTYCFPETTEPDPTQRTWAPQLIASPTFVSIAAGQISQCGLTAAGETYCWGNPTNSVLGNPAATGTEPSVAVTGNHAFTTIYAGKQSYCGVTATHETWCWGANFDLSYPESVGFSQPTIEPVLITSAGSLVFDTRAMAYSHSCGIESTTSLVYCWGVDVDDHLGDGPSSDPNQPWSLVPVLVSKGP